MALVTDFTSPDYDSYLTLAKVETCMTALDGFYNITSWTALTDPIKENLILGATQNFNKFEFFGAISQSINSPFNMKWPRSEAFYTNGVGIENDEIPEFICCYIPERIIELQAQVQDGSFYDGRISKQKVGSLEQSFQNPRDSRLLKSTLRNNPSFKCISDYVLGGARSNMRYLTRA